MMTESSPPREQRGRRMALWFGLFGAPALWSVQLMSGFAVSAHGCFPQSVPLTSATVGVRAIVTLISVVAAAGAVAAGLIAHASWQGARDAASGSERAKLDGRQERIRFMALGGMMMSALFLFAILLSFVSIAVVSPCTYGA
jgi:hypothetical protein